MENTDSLRYPFIKESDVIVKRVKKWMFSKILLFLFHFILIIGLFSIVNDCFGAFSFIGDMDSYEQSGSSVTFTCGSRRVRVTAITDDTVRVRMDNGSGTFINDTKPQYVVIKWDWDPVNITVEDKGIYPDEYVEIKTSKLIVKAYKTPFKLAMHNIYGNLISQQYKNGSSYGLGWDGSEVCEWRELRAGDHFYGFGEKFDPPADKRGQKCVQSINDNLYNLGDNTYVNASFFMSTLGYGIFLNNHWKVVYDMGEESPSYYYTKADGGELDYYFIYGPGLKDVLYRYTEITGRSPLLPKYAYGVWFRFYNNQNDALTHAGYIRNDDGEGYPADVFGFDSTWTAIDGDLEFDSGKYSDPAYMLDQLRNTYNLHVNAWDSPWISNAGGSQDDFSYASGQGWLKDGCCIGGTNAQWLDFTVPSAADWWWNRHNGQTAQGGHTLFDWGLDSFKNDRGETLSTSPNFSNGMTVEEIHNIYPLLYNKTTYEGTQKFISEQNGGFGDTMSGRGIVFCRGGWSGLQRYPLIWAGDTRADYADPPENGDPGIPAVLRAGLSAGMSGFAFWAWDGIGFFTHPSDTQGWKRAFQATMFSPVSHVFRDDDMTWRSSSEIRNGLRQYAKLRYRLLPYIYSSAWESHQKGVPMMRHLALEYQNDANVYLIDDQYLFGSCIMACPMVHAGNTRSIYLPFGEWYNWWDDTKYTGLQTIANYSVPDDNMALLVKAGAIIPTISEESPYYYVEEMPTHMITMDIYPSGTSTYELYEDDGYTLYYTTGSYAKTLYQCTDTSNIITFDISAREGSYLLDTRDYMLKFHDGSANTSIVTLNSIELNRYYSLNELKLAASGWFRNEATNILYVKFPDDGGNNIVQLLQAYPGNPDYIYCSSSPGSIAANGTSTSIITATIKDSVGIPCTQASNTIIFTVVGEGTLMDTLVKSASAGVATVKLRSTTNVGTATVKATAVNLSEGTAGVVTNAGSPAKINNTAAPTVIVNNGTTTSLITAGVYDTFDNIILTASDWIEFSLNTENYATLILSTSTLSIESISVQSGRFYITAMINVNDEYYIDRAATISSIPPLGYEELTWIKTANDDKQMTANPFLTFYVNTMVTVYVGIDTRISVPGWMSTWVNTGNSIVETGGVVFTLYEKDYMSGTVSLGANEGVPESNMYIVLVRQAGAGGNPKKASGGIATVLLQSTVTDGTTIVTATGSGLLLGTVSVKTGSAGPPVTVLSASQRTDDTGMVDIIATIEDGYGDNCRMKVEYSLDGGSSWINGDLYLDSIYSATYGSPVLDNAGAYQITDIITNPGPNTVTVIWDTKSGLNGTGSLDNTVETDVKVRITGNDGSDDGIIGIGGAFTMDNLAPSVSVSAGLESRPESGDVSVVVSAVFGEDNPGTNMFFTALNSGSYGTGVPGEVGTASPLPQEVQVYTILDGDDYVNAVKCEHTDYYGNTGTNESTPPSLNYVKPYKPGEPTVDNPTSTSVDVTINKHNNEADGLQYCIYEGIRADQYVQSDGTLDSTETWQTRGDWGTGSKITVTGLSEPVDAYYFQIRSRNPGDSAAESDYSSMGSSGSGDVWIQTTDEDFNAGTTSNTVVSGMDSGAYVELADGSGNSTFVVTLSNANGGEWEYRKAITVNNTGSQLTDYQVHVTEAGINFESHAQPDLDDVRFTNSSDTELSYWIGTKGGIAGFWVKVPTVNNGNTTLYVYYGNALATTVSNIKATFILGDDFDDETLDTGLWTWVRESVGNWDEGTLKTDWLMMRTLEQMDLYQTDNDAPVLRAQSGITGDIEAVVRIDMNATVAYQQAALFIYSDDDNYVRCGKLYHSADLEVAEFGNEVSAVWNRVRVSETTDDILCRIVREGTTYTGYYSTNDGANWTQVMQYSGISLANSYPALVAFAGGVTSTEIDAYFDDLRVRKYTSSEPSVTGVSAEEMQGTTYVLEGTFISQNLNPGTITSWDYINWIEDISGAGTALRLQVATGNNPDPVDFKGPDGQGTSYYSIPSGEQLWAGHSNDTYLRYKGYLTDNDGSQTPKLEDIMIRYIIESGGAHHMECSADPQSITSDGISVSTVTASICDIGSELVSNAGNAVSFSITGDGTLLGTTSKNAAAGIAIVEMRSTTDTGMATIIATAVDLEEGSVSIFTIQGPPKTMLNTADPMSIKADGIQTSLITAKVYDDWGHFVSTASNEVVFSVSGEGTLLAPTTPVAVNGMATVMLRSSTNVGTAMVTATSIGMTEGTVEVEIIPGDPEKIITTASPVSIIANGSDTSLITAVVADNLSRHIMTAINNMTFAISGAGVLMEPVNVDAEGGIATVIMKANLVIGISTVTVYSVGLDTGTIEVVTEQGAPAKLNNTASPTSIIAEGIETSLITARVLDLFDRDIITATNEITFMLDGPGVLSGDTSGNAVGGIATVELMSTLVAGWATVTSKAVGLTDGSVKIWMDPLPPVSITVTAEPVIIVANGISASVITVEIKDANNYTVINATNSITFVRSGMGYMDSEDPETKTIILSAVGGISTVRFMSYDIGTSTITVSSADLGVEVLNLTATIGQPDRILLETNPPGIRVFLENEGSSVDIETRIVDSSNRTIDINSDITLEITGIVDSVPETKAASGGMAVFNNRRFDGNIGYYNVIARSDALGIESNVINIATLISQNAGTLINKTFDDGSVVVEIPANSLTEDVIVEISMNLEEEFSTEEIPDIESWREIVPGTIYSFLVKDNDEECVNCGFMEYSFNSNIKIHLPYKDLDSNGIVDGTSIKAEDLVICHLERTPDPVPPDSLKYPWVLLDGEDGRTESVVYTSSNTVVAEVNHFSIYALKSINPSVGVGQVVNYPNPFNDQTTIIYNLDINNDVTIRIYTISGRLIRTIPCGFLSSGYNEKVWDGMDEEGNIVSNGIYFYKVTAGSGKDTSVSVGKAVRIR